MPLSSQKAALFSIGISFFKVKRLYSGYDLVNGKES